MANVHELKTWSEYYQAVYDGSKRFEVRKDDRDFQVGDTLHLREWEAHHMKGFYTGRECTCTVTFKLSGGQFGIEDGYCVLGIANVETIEERKRADQ